jgi:hypothetical protein
MKTTLEIDRQIYELARGYLPSLNIPGVTQALIEKYLNPPHPRPTSKDGLYLRILESAQNAHMKAGVIGKSIGGVDKLAPVLIGFNPQAVLARYGDNWQDVLDQIEKELKPRGQIRKMPQSIWPRYCRTILSAARFLEQFESADKFYDWVDFFERDERARASLPMLMDREIDGLGFALSCDFLKELGYANFPKPDVHLRHIFTELQLSPVGVDDYHLFNAIIRLARHASVTPYNADIVFWLIGSGNFYDDPLIGEIGSHEKDFVEFARLKIFEDK